MTLSALPVRFASSTALLASAVLGAGCADDGDATGANADAECGGHGTLHIDHCHCEPGFELTPDELSCVPEQDDASDDHDHEGDAGDGHDHEGDAGDGHDHDEDLAFAPSDVRAATGTADDGTSVWFMEAVDGDAILSLEIYAAFGGPTSPGVVELTDVETNYATCGTCIVLQTGCSAHGDHFHCERAFMPRAQGHMHVDAIGGAAGELLEGELMGVVFEEVEIADDFETRRVAGGAELRLDAWAFSATLESLDGADEECGGHGEMHGDHCHCDAGYVPDPMDPSQCIPE